MDTIENNAIDDKTGWVVFLDVFGFEAMFTTQENYNDLHIRLKTCHEKVAQKIVMLEEKTFKIIFSDSLFLFYIVTNEENKHQVLKQCISDIRSILSIFAEQDLCLKGGMAYGQVIYGNNILLGAPVLRAYGYEREMIIPLVLLPLKEVLEYEKNEKYAYLPQMNDCRLKNGGIIYGSCILPRKLKAFTQLAKTKYEEYRITGPYDVAHRWKQALDFVKNL